MDVVVQRQKTDMDHSNIANARTSISVHHIPSGVDLEGQDEQGQENSVPNSYESVPNGVSNEPNSADPNKISDTQQESDFYKSRDEDVNNPAKEVSPLLENEAQESDMHNGSGDQKPALVVPQISITLSEDEKENGHLNGKLVHKGQTECPEVEIESTNQKSGCLGRFKQMTLFQLFRFDKVISFEKKNQ